MKIDSSWRTNMAQEVTNQGCMVALVGSSLYCLKNFCGYSVDQYFRQGLKWSVIPASIGLAHTCRKEFTTGYKWKLRQCYAGRYRALGGNKWPIMFKIVATAIAVSTIFLLDRYIGAPPNAKIERLAPRLARFQLWMTKWGVRGLGLCIPAVVITGLAKAIKVSIEDDSKKGSMN